MEEQNIKFKPCPFCGSRNISMHYLFANGYYVLCEKCETKSGYALTRKESIKHWNTRLNNEL